MPRQGMAVRIQIQHQVGVLLLLLGFLILRVPAVVAQTDQGTVNAAPQSSRVPRSPRVGGRDDLDAIGSRKIGGKALGNWYSLDNEIRMGKQYAEVVESTVTLLRDPAINEYVNRVGQNLVHNSDAKVPFTIKMIDSDEINAFELLAGFLYVTTSLVMAASNETELAGVMNHKIAQMSAGHTSRQIT